MSQDDSDNKKSPNFNMDALRQAIQKEGRGGKEEEPEGVRFDGFAAVTEMFRHMDEESKERILQNVAQQDPTLVARIKDSLISFEDLKYADASGIQRLIQEVPSMKWAVALRKVSDEVKIHIFDHISRRAQENLEEEIDSVGPQQLATVRAAQKDIVDAAQRLEKEGKLEFQRSTSTEEWVE